MIPIKIKILENLEDLRSKISQSRHAEVITLNSFYECDCGTTFTLSIEMLVSKATNEKGIRVVRGFEIYSIHLFKNNGENANFSYTKDEIIDYIDF